LTAEARGREEERPGECKRPKLDMRHESRRTWSSNRALRRV